MFSLPATIGFALGGVLARLIVGQLFCRWWYGRELLRLRDELRKLGADKTPPLSDPDARGEVDALLRQIHLRQEELARESHEARFDLNAVLAGLDDGVIVADRRCRIRLVNPSLLQIFQLKSEPVGESVLSTIRLPILQTMLEGVLQEGAPQQAEVDLQNRGTSTHLVISAAPLRDSASLAGAVVVVRDVSRLRRLEEMRREFVANVSHELRTPLSIFHGYLENLLETPDADHAEVEASLKVMRKHSLRMNSLVEDLLTLARLESGRDVLQPEPIDLREFLEEVRDEWEHKSAAKGVALQLRSEQSLPEVMVDTMKFRQVLDNLLDNAVKHTPGGGSVTLSVERPRAGEQSSQQMVEVAVADTGSGIPPADLPHIFERFYRADKARSRELGGTGLGLAIVKHIAQAHGGGVVAESEVGRGTRVVLSLPAAG